MMDEEQLRAIEAHWSDVRWTYGTTRYGSVYLQTHHGDIEVDDETEEVNALRLAARAPADIQALVAEVHRLRAVADEKPKFIIALAATIDTRRIARPTTGLRDGCGYFVAEGRVWWYDRMELGANFTPRVKPADWLPPWDVLSGEWEVVGR